MKLVFISRNTTFFIVNAKKTRNQLSGFREHLEILSDIESVSHKKQTQFIFLLNYMKGKYQYCLNILQQPISRHCKGLFDDDSI
jgi:hypothetical protein